jgi:hypothetical protein
MSWLKMKGVGIVQVGEMTGINNKLETAKISVANKGLFSGWRQTTWDTLEYVPGELGYIGPYYVVRSPLRRNFKQGLTSGTMFILGEKGNLSGFSERIFTDNAKDVSICLENTYRKIDDVMEELEETGEQQPLSRSFCLSGDYKLKYKEIPIGRLTGNDKFKLESNFDFLSQELGGTVGYERISF